jgi:glyoxylase-like metal-dependent hydrolase (beta-lactamase superfamily II)
MKIRKIRKKSYVIFAFTLILSATGWAQSKELGPYTVHMIREDVYRIEDANSGNPPGVVIGDDGQMVSMNNCSDMYLVTGKEKGLLIDLSNAVQWDQSATASLRALVEELLDGKPLLIAVTHNHGDHLGMLPAFAEDPAVRFWVPENEFKGTGIFPADRTTYFTENASLDLGGGVRIATLEIPGHTPHSTCYMLEGEDLMFTGDAIGSGSGIWLFDEASFYVYKNSVDELISYIENQVNRIDKEKLQFYGGHFWQGAQVGTLGIRYAYDMRTLIKEMKKGSAETEEMSTFIPFLDTSFKYGTATISWNKEAAKKYAHAQSESSD